MQFNVTNVVFDFNDSTLDPLSTEDKLAHIQDTLGVWEVEDEEELVDKISDCIGYCIKSINYHWVSIQCFNHVSISKLVPVALIETQISKGS